MRWFHSKAPPFGYDIAEAVVVIVASEYSSASYPSVEKSAGQSHGSIDSDTSAEDAAIDTLFGELEELSSHMEALSVISISNDLVVLVGPIEANAPKPMYHKAVREASFFADTLRSKAASLAGKYKRI